MRGCLTLVQEKKTFLDLVSERQSTRKFSDEKVELDVIKRCIEAARLAPSACNSQPWIFHVVQDSEQVQKIAEMTLQKGTSLNKFALEAQALVVLTATKGNLRTKVGQMVSGLPYYLIDAGIAAEHFCLQATEEGLGTCMIGWFNEKKIRTQLKMNRDERVALVIAMGHPRESLTKKKVRKKLDEIMRVYE